MSFDGTFVRITTEDGLEGWGESPPFGSNLIASHALGVRAGIAEIAPKLIRLDPRRVDRINEVMDDALLGHEHAKVAIDVACWVSSASQQGFLFASSLEVAPISKDSRGLSVKIGGKPVIDAACMVEAFKDKKPDEWFVVDANGGLTVEGALRMLRPPPKELDFSLEAPCRTWRECISLRRRTNIPIIHDEPALTEVSMAQMIADDVGEGINLKVQKFGGLTKAHRVRDLCLAAGYVISVRETCGSDIGFAALVHLSQTIPEQALRWSLRAATCSKSKQRMMHSILSTVMLLHLPNQD